MTRTRKTFTSTEPPKANPLDDIESQIKAFYAKGGKPEIVPEGVTADVLRTRRDLSEMSAKNRLGGQKGGASKSANAKTLGKQTYASAMARKPKPKQQIVLRKREHADE